LAIHSQLQGAAAVHQWGIMSESDPGAIGAYKVWFVPSTGVWKVRNAANSGWIEPAAAASMPWTSVTGKPTTFTPEIHALFSNRHSDIDSTDIPANGEVLTYDSVSGKWKSSALPGGFAGGYPAPASVSSSGNVSDSSPVEHVNASSGAVTRTLPTAVGRAGRVYKVKKVDTSANAVTVATTSAQTIDSGPTSWNIRYFNEALEFISDGANWQIHAESIDLPINDLRDVDTGGLATGDLLQFDGTAWVPVAPGDLGISGGGGSAFQHPNEETLTAAGTADVTTKDLTIGDTTSGAFSITVPTAVGKRGYEHTFTKLSASPNASLLTIAFTTGEFKDPQTGSNANLSTEIEGDSVTIRSNGTRWLMTSAPTGYYG
jgi:hypothetical protein